MYLRRLSSRVHFATVCKSPASIQVRRLATEPAHDAPHENSPDLHSQDYSVATQVDTPPLAEINKVKKESTTVTITQTVEQSESGTDGTSTLTKKTTAQLDDELMRKMAALAGDGGEAGIEYEDGQPTAMKRSVRENMFRYI